MSRPLQWFLVIGREADEEEDYACIQAKTWKGAQQQFIRQLKEARDYDGPASEREFYIDLIVCTGDQAPDVHLSNIGWPFAKAV